MNFTREPLVETVITAKEGYKLALRNSKGGGQEEFFVDALEVVTFGTSCFYRSLEKPKSFLLPVTDYEIIEVREARMVLKPTAVERGIKIAGGREAPLKPPREEKEEEKQIQEEEEATGEEPKVEKRRERRRTRKRRKGGEQERSEAAPAPVEKPVRQVEKPTLIPPPSTLISETINRYKEIVIHETPVREEEPALKKGEEFFEEPSEDSSERMKRAQPQEPIEDDEEIPF